MRTIGRSLLVAVIAGVAVPLLSSMVAPAADASASSACAQINSTLSSLQTTLGAAASNPKKLASEAASVSEQLTALAAASGSASVTSSVSVFTNELKAAASGNVDIAKLTADANAIGGACAAATAASGGPSSASAPAASGGAVVPSGAPATGAGGTSGFADEGLLAAGAAVVLAGLATVFGSRRRRGAHPRA